MVTALALPKSVPAMVPVRISPRRAVVKETAAAIPGPPDGFVMQPPEAYDRRHHLQDETCTQRAVNFLQNVIEGVLVKFSTVGDKAVFDRRSFSWLDEVEADWRKVRSELDTVMQYRDAMPSFQEIVKEVGTIQSDDQWKTFFLRGVGMDCEENARRCPETMKVLAKIPGCSTAFFSILSPRKRIPPHRGPWAGVLRLHLGLLVPQPAHECRIRVADQVHAWQEGHALIFDDTYNHEVWNDTSGYRVVLFVDFARPLRWPMNILNHWLMNLSALAPFLREAKGRQRASEKRFWEIFGNKV